MAAARYLAAGALLACAAPAAAENWRMVSMDPDSVQYVDADSIVRTGDRVRFTREVRWHRSLPSGDFMFDRVVQLAEVSCAERILYPLGSVAMLGERSMDSDGAWDPEPMLPETNLGGTHDAVCSDRWESGTIADRAAHARAMERQARKSR